MQIEGNDYSKKPNFSEWFVNSEWLHRLFYE